MSKTALGPWRAAINWHSAVLIFGSFAATIFPTIPYLAACCIKYGLPPPQPSWTTLRILQILQSIVISNAGGYMAFVYFMSKYDITYAQMRFQLKVIAIAVPLFCVLILLGISIPRYGITTPLLLSGLLVFGTFTVIFLAGSFHYAQRLTTSGQQGAEPDGGTRRGTGAGGDSAYTGGLAAGKGVIHHRGHRDTENSKDEG